MGERESKRETGNNRGTGGKQTRTKAAPPGDKGDNGVVRKAQDITKTEPPQEKTKRRSTGVPKLATPRHLARQPERVRCVCGVCLSMNL